MIFFPKKFVLNQKNKNCMCHGNTWLDLIVFFAYKRRVGFTLSLCFSGPRMLLPGGLHVFSHNLPVSGASEITGLRFLQVQIVGRGIRFRICRDGLCDDGASALHTKLTGTNLGPPAATTLGRSETVISHYLACIRNTTPAGCDWTVRA